MPDTLWQFLIYGLPGAFIAAALWLGITYARQRGWWKAAMCVFGAWVALMLVFLVTGATRVHGPDLAFVGLVFVTPAIAAVFAIGLWIGRRSTP